MTGRLERPLFAGLIVLMIGTVATILITTQRTTDRVAVDQMSQVMGRVALEAGDEAAVFLDPAERLATLSADLIEDGLFDESQPDQLEEYLLDQLRLTPAVAGMYVGRPDGDFFYVSYNADVAGAQIRTKVISVDGPARTTSLLYRALDGELVERATDPDDPYDPRTRPWYQAASVASGAIWTDPYIFFTSGQPGVTVAAPIREDGEPLGVFGVDTELRELSDILTRLELSERGGAFIVDGDGFLVALRGAAEIGLEDGNELRRRRPTELDDADAAAAEATVRAVGGPRVGQTTFTQMDHAGESWRVLVEPFADGRWDWTMVIYAPDSDFLGELRRTQAANTRLAVAIGLLATLVALAIAAGLRHPIRALQRSAYADALTGLPNRRSVQDSAQRVFDDAALDERPVSVGMIDIDRFKAVNDSYGHGVGDEVLKAVATRMRRALPDTEVLARFGGEEFVLLLPDTTSQTASEIGDRLRRAVNGAPINTSKGPIPVTVSIGLAQAGPATGRTFRDVLQVADRALYRAKASGRDRVEIAGGDGTAP